MLRFSFPLTTLLALSLAGRSAVAAVIVNPSQDVMVVQDLSTANALAYDTAFGTTFGNALNAEGFSGHTTNSVIQFDLSNLSASGITSASGIGSATLNLYSVSASTAGLDAFGALDPTVATPVTVSATALAASWNQGTLAWGTGPSFPLSTTGGVAGSASVSGTGEWITVDLTGLVKDWVSGAIANNGLLLTGDAGSGTSPVGATFDSSRFGNSPFLSITAVPEPSTLVLAGVGSAMAIGLAVRRLRSRRLAVAR